MRAERRGEVKSDASGEEGGGEGMRAERRGR